MTLSMANFLEKIEIQGDKIVSGHLHTQIIAETDPKKLPWKDLNIDFVIESTGRFTKPEDAKAHLDAGAKRVVIFSAC